MDLKASLKDRAVFVTGADGFIGSHLVDKLVESGARVHVFIRATSSGELHNIHHQQNGINIHRGDLADKHALGQALSCLKSEDEPLVFHLGAQAHVGESWQRPYETISANVLGTLNLLQSVVDLGLKLGKLVASGTSEEYGNVDPEIKDRYRFEGNGLILDERSPLNPKSIYAVSKIATDFLTRDYYHAYGVPGVVTRMFNNYGPRQNPRYVTGTIITQALAGDTVHLGYVKSKRDFCYCEDGVMGHLSVGLYGNPGEVYVYGQGKNCTIHEWYELIVSQGRKLGYWKGNKKLVTSPQRGRLGSTEVEELRVDYAKLNRLCGWQPTFSWEEGLGRTIKWYAENKARWMGRVDWLQG